MNNSNRRTFLFMSSGVAAGSMLVEGIAEADETVIPEFAGSGRRQVLRGSQTHRDPRLP